MQVVVSGELTLDIRNLLDFVSVIPSRGSLQGKWVTQAAPPKRVR